MISDVYAKLIFLDLLNQRYLKLGKSPGLNALKSLENQAVLQNAGANGSRVKYEPDEKSEGSAKEINKSLDIFKLEIETIQKAGDQLKSLAQRAFDKANNNLALINQDAIDTTLSICTFELARQNNMHLSNYDSLINFTKIDQQLTTAEIDSQARMISLRRRPFMEKLDITQLKKTAFDVFVIGSSYLGLNLMQGSSFLNMLDNTESYWIHQLITREQGEKTIALQVDLGTITNIASIVLKPLEADSESGIAIRVLVSPDGTKWQEMAGKQFYRIPEIRIQLTPSNGRYLRVEFSKIKPSFEINNGETVQVYEFGLDSLQVFQNKYYPRGQFVSKPIELKEQFSGNLPQPINRLRVDVSDEKPPGTEIVYYISTNNNTDLLTRIEPGQEIILNTVLESRNDQAKVKSRFDNNHALVDLELNDDFIPESIRFFKNTFQRNILIDTVGAGWKFQDSYFSCIIEVEKDFEIDLGINFAIINGQKRNGINIIPPGFHEFKTHEVNWVDAKTEDSDPLFPHNHKLLIEGLPGSQLYKGVDFQAAEELKLISAFDLIKNVPNSDTRFFAIRNRNPMIKIARPPVLVNTIEGWRLEQHALRYKYKTLDLTQIDAVTLIAKLTSNSDLYTPILRGYVMIAGF